MADNSSLPVASGNETFANDDIGSVKYPRVKVTWGPDGTANDTDVAANKPMPIQVRAADGTAVSFAALGQAAMAASSPVVIASNQSSVPVTEASGSAIATSLAIIDDWDAADSCKVKNGGSEYETVAASQTAQVLGATGGTGDYIAGLLVIPATTSPGNVLLLDNATSITVFTGGGTSVSNLVPFYIPLGLISVSGAWKVTTGSNVSVIGIGDFT